MAGLPAPVVWDVEVEDVVEVREGDEEEERHQHQDEHPVLEGATAPNLRYEVLQLLHDYRWKKEQTVKKPFANWKKGQTLLKSLLQTLIYDALLASDNYNRSCFQYKVTNNKYGKNLAYKYQPTFSGTPSLLPPKENRELWILH